MVNENKIKKRLAAGEKVLGCFLGLPGIAAAELLTLIGYECVLIDREHGQASMGEATAQMVAAKAAGGTAFLRIPKLDLGEVKYALDAGVSGIMVPMISSVAEAELLAKACAYPPVGIRGTAPYLIRASSYGLYGGEYPKIAREELVVIAQIETKEGIEAVEDIAAVPGIDLLFAGPSDISASLGYLGQADHPEVRAAIDKILAAAKKHKKWAGITPSTQHNAAARFKAGFDLVLAGSDVGFMREGATAALNAQKLI
ncbi:MAG: aldolase/citrate lyase family protein [Alphaproteobacteria bacterium]